MPRRKKQPIAPLPVPQATVAATPAPIQPTTPAVLKLQEQVVQLVALRTEARQRLTGAHAVYLEAQAQFQATQGELQGIEAEVNYRISLIAQLENRAPQSAVLNFPAPSYPDTGLPTLAGVSSEPTPQAVRRAVEQSDPSDLINRGHAAPLRAQI